VPFTARVTTPLSPFSCPRFTDRALHPPVRPYAARVLYCPRLLHLCLTSPIIPLISLL